MENNSTIVVVGVTAVVIVVSYLIYKQMGCNVSASVGASAPDDKAKSESKKESAKDVSCAG